MIEAFTLSSDGPRGGEENMRRDFRLFQAAEDRREVGARIYRWDGPWVSLGRFQVPERDLLHPATTPWVVRPTGGKAVLHGHDVTVGMAVPFEVVGAGPRDLKRCYRWVAARIIEAMRACGVPAELGERTAFAGVGKHTADCFSHVAANDIVHAETGVKICGCALLMGQRSVLLQASIPYGDPLVRPQDVLRNAQIHRTEPWDASGFHDALRESLERSPEAGA